MSAKKRLPERKNRGTRMAELEKNEEKLKNNEMYQGIFEEEDSDGDFDLGDVSASEVEEMEKDNELNEEESEEEYEEEEVKKKEPSRRRKKSEDEIIDIDRLDIDKIDYIEDLRDRGIDVDEDVEFDGYSSEKDDDDEDFDRRGRRKKPQKKQKKKPKKKVKEDVEPEIRVDISVESEPLPKSSVGKSPEKDPQTTLSVVLQDYDDASLPLNSRKRHRTNKFESLLKKPKRDKLNKNVTVVGSRHNPRAIIISKNIYNEKDENEEAGENNNTLSFNLEQELDAKNIIKKYKQKQKESKQSYFQDKIISQEQRLLESIFTEWANKNSLKAMQKLEDLNKRENTTTNKSSFIDYVKVLNTEKGRDPKDINKVDVSFSNLTYYNKVFNFFNTKPKHQEQKKCAITGQPAKYYDPLTKSYYSNIETFKLLRERYFQKEEDGLLFRIQTLSDLASQKKERLKKMILTDGDGNNAISGGNVQVAKKENAIMSIVNKYGILKNDGNEFEKRVVSHRIYNRNRENCVESGMLLEANKIKLVISKKIFKDKYSSKLPTTMEDVIKPINRVSVIKEVNDKAAPQIEVKN